MRQGSSQEGELILRLLGQIRDLVDETIGLLGKTNRPAKTKVGNRTPKAPPADSSKLDYGMPIRAFFKKYQAGLSGPKKFTLLVAYLSKGNLQKSVPTADLRKNWNKMKGLLGFEFNTFYSTSAKDSDWVNAERNSYRLRPSWKEIFN
jgi:hypothetical protein